jgi:hypothetical protein
MMIHRSLPYQPTPEDRLTRAKWERGFGIVYGTILLLLLAIVAAQHIRGENGATGIASGPAAQPVRTDRRPTTAIGSPSASRTSDGTSTPDQHIASPYLQERMAP